MMEENYSKLPDIWYPSNQNSHATSKNIREKFAVVDKLTSETSCDAHLFTHHVVALPSSIRSSACPP
jgi:hypothetical protein